MVAAGFVAQLMTGALFHQGYGAYVVLLREEFGWSSTSLSAAYSMARFESGLLGPLEGWLVDHFGPRAIMRIGILIFGAGLMLLSQIDSLPTFYAAFIVMSLGASLGSFLPITVAIVNWFQRRRATALSIMSTGFATGGLLVPVVVLSLETFGWRTTAFASGIIVLVVGLPLSLLIRHRPEDYGQQVDGGPAASKDGKTSKPIVEEVSFRPGEAVRTPAFWLISLGHGSALLVVTAVMVHLVPHLHENLGYSLVAAGLIVSLMTVMQIIGQIGGGILGDRFSKRIICAACMGMHMTGLLLVAYAVTIPMVIGFAVLHGLGWGIRGPMMQAIRADYFGRASFGTIVGLSSLIVMFGTTGGPLVAGILADTTGSYQIGFTALALFAGFGSTFFLLAKKPPPPKRPALDESRALELQPSPGAAV
jgi:MFS family permease